MKALAVLIHTILLLHLKGRETKAQWSCNLSWIPSLRGQQENWIWIGWPCWFQGPLQPDDPSQPPRSLKYVHCPVPCYFFKG